MINTKNNQNYLPKN